MTDSNIPSDPKEIAALMERWACAEIRSTEITSMLKTLKAELERTTAERDRLWKILKECVQEYGSATRPSRILSFHTVKEVTILEWCKDLGRSNIYIANVLGK